MIAYMVKYKGQEWCDPTHAENAKDAIKLFWKQWGGEGEYIDIRAIRLPALDDLPLTGNNIVDIAGWGEEWRNSKSDTCRCQLCRGKPCTQR